MAADSPVFPHCDFHRMPKSAFVLRLAGPAQSASSRTVARASQRPMRRTPLRALLVLAMALLAISGYASLRESGLETRLKTMSAYHWLDAIDEQPSGAPDDEETRTRRAADTLALRTRTVDRSHHFRRTTDRRA
ncbi:MAG: hypothetical protein CBHOC_4595 [uncultured Caballeronia sp.]|nr:MAG: hypothetical protein CBHOC_4595 [uncultured Caballeronia sp.]